jgi:hypothetical protein
MKKQQSNMKDAKKIEEYTTAEKFVHFKMLLYTICCFWRKKKALDILTKNETAYLRAYNTVVG